LKSALLGQNDFPKIPKKYLGRSLVGRQTALI
jgi:hypothetical protein